MHSIMTLAIGVLRVTQLAQHLFQGRARHVRTHAIGAQRGYMCKRKWAPWLVPGYLAVTHAVPLIDLLQSCLLGWWGGFEQSYGLIP